MRLGQSEYDAQCVRLAEYLRTTAGPSEQVASAFSMADESYDLFLARRHADRLLKEGPRRVAKRGEWFQQRRVFKGAGLWRGLSTS